MSYPYINSKKDLLTILKNLLADELGKFSNGQPAIYVEPPSVPKGQITGGVQCIIRRWRNVYSTEPLANGQINENFEWLVTITLFEVTDAGLLKFENVISKMRQRFPLKRETIMNWNDENYPQATYRLGNTEIFQGDY